MPKISIDKIKIGVNRRPLNGEKVKDLKESIQANGLLNPITLDQHYNLVAGLHRLTACQMLGLEEIECNVVNYEDAEQSRLAEIDENLIRNELEPLERNELWLEREQILQRMGLRAKAGDNQYTLKGSATISPPAKTTKDIAKKTGFSERTLQQGLQIAKAIHPEVKQLIKETPLTKSTTAQLEIARTATAERTLAEQAEEAAQLAKAKGEEQEAERQAQLAAESRAKQKELQLLAFKSAIAQKQAKSAVKKVPNRLEQPDPKTTVIFKEPQVKFGDELVLGRHLVYCGDTSSKDFRQLLPSNAALAIATLSPTWNHDYLVDEARIVAVLRSQDQIYEFCSQTRMPYQYELIISNLYIGIFSHQSIPKPQTPIHIEGIEGIINYLINFYTSHQDQFVIAPFMGNGEILSASEKMGRICFIGDHNPELVSREIIRWEKWTGKKANIAVGMG
ncbi:MAG: ParB N-terminal domain-containing protein [Pelatocladus maniniholoensis HA4357-MV3]|jgi:ParB family chromosome partitioning protein|uniref:ParB N-terminal domain-containing protein n=1 Tax=Pelatocladus maniniholoensis HA4357-MV3 TaxID=1117104 RepID=A0A9E3LUQ5_9NOST|nr:ParB N-terminal domain-containing protein [Pelatocladus maniniholoensis HA4357-MV3]BAZ68892.1 ParB family protein [Fischerella sp. NIES-4106]